MNTNRFATMRNLGHRLFMGFGNFMLSMELTEVRTPRTYWETRLTWQEMNTRWL